MGETAYSVLSGMLGVGIHGNGFEAAAAFGMTNNANNRWIVTQLLGDLNDALEPEAASGHEARTSIARGVGVETLDRQRCHGHAVMAGFPGVAPTPMA